MECTSPAEDLGIYSRHDSALRLADIDRAVTGHHFISRSARHTLPHFPHVRGDRWSLLIDISFRFFGVLGF